MVDEIKSKDEFSKPLDEFFKPLDDSQYFVAHFFNDGSDLKGLSENLEELSKDYKSVKFVKVNVDDNREISDYFSIGYFPTVLLFRGKSVFSRLVRPDIMDMENIEDWKAEIDKLIKGSK